MNFFETLCLDKVLNLSPNESRVRKLFGNLLLIAFDSLEKVELERLRAVGVALRCPLPRMELTDLFNLNSFLLLTSNSDRSKGNDAIIPG